MDGAPPHPASDRGLDHYAQGGVVVGGVGYFTGNEHDYFEMGRDKPPGFPYVVAFDVETFRTIRTYPFRDTYDSSPLVIPRRDGTWLVLAHEWETARTVAMDRDTAEPVWTSPANQPGKYFFGYSWYLRPDGTRLVLAPSSRGLHALSAEDGREVWFAAAPSEGGITPCVDQAGGLVYFQSRGRLWKLRAEDGRPLASAVVPRPCGCISWNTALADGTRGRFIATYWYEHAVWSSALRVYDTELDLVWEKTGLPFSKKETLCCAEGRIFAGTGNGWLTYEGDGWKYIAAYDLATGETVWQRDLSDHRFGSIPNVLYCGGRIFAETANKKGGPPSEILRLNAADGSLEDVFTYPHPVSSCAPFLAARGKILSGDLCSDSVLVTEFARNSTAEWPGPFGDAQAHTMVLPGDPGLEFIPMRRAAGS